MSIAGKLEKLETDITSAYSAINTKGGTIPQNKNTENLSDAITSIPSGGGSTGDATAAASDILSPKTAYIATGKVTGTMTNNGVLSYTPSMSEQSIPSGYTSGGTINSIEDSEKYEDWNELADNIAGTRGTGYITTDLRAYYN